MTSVCRNGHVRTRANTAWRMRGDKKAIVCRACESCNRRKRYRDDPEYRIKVKIARVAYLDRKEERAT